jgi:hypothetical protein
MARQSFSTYPNLQHPGQGYFGSTLDPTVNHATKPAAAAWHQPAYQGNNQPQAREEAATTGLTVGPTPPIGNNPTYLHVSSLEAGLTVGPDPYIGHPQPYVAY